jgi:hypothetical protein
MKEYWEGLGAVLGQTTDSGNRVVLSYASRSLTSAEQNYSPTHLEGLTVIWAGQHFRHYLWGRRFTLQTNHTALLSLFKTDEPLSGRLVRWQAILMEYKFDVVHIQIKTNPADFLYRYLITSATSTEKDDLLIVDLRETNATLSGYRSTIRKYFAAYPTNIFFF